MKTPCRVFICYAREDEKNVLQLYDELSRREFEPWMDKDILPGEKWEKAIRTAIENSDFFLVCLSGKATYKRGFIQKELKVAFEIFEEMMDDDIYLIPVRLEDCPVPDKLSEIQRVDLFEEGGHDRLFESMKTGIKRRSEVKEELHTAVQRGRAYTSHPGLPQTGHTVKELVKLLLQTFDHIEPAKKRTFEREVELPILNSSIDLIEALGKKAHGRNTADSRKTSHAWRELRTRYERLRRRQLLLNPASQEEFETTLMWMAEQGLSDDSVTILEVKKNPPYESNAVARLIQKAIQRISERISHPRVAVEIPLDKSTPDEVVVALTNIKFKEEDEKRISELLQAQREQEIDDKGAQELDSLMDVYEKSILKKSEALAEAVRRGLREPLGDGAKDD